MTLDELVGALAAHTGWASQQHAADSATLTVALPQGRKQAIRVDLVQWSGLPLARLRTVVGPKSALTGERPRFALSLNGGLVFGSLAIAGEDLVMTHTLMLHGLVPGEAFVAAAYLATQADELERKLFHQDQA